MTVLRKCETCRARKIKCDEAQPSCGACVKKNMACVYKYSEKGYMFVQEQLAPQQVRSGAIRKPMKTSLQKYDNNKSKLSGQRNDSSVLSNLNLRERRMVGCGIGEMLTFTIRPLTFKKPGNKYLKFETKTPAKNSESSGYVGPPAALLWSTTTGLGMRWIVVFEASPCKATANIYDAWARNVPSLIGHANYLDLAIAYFVDSMMVFLQSSKINERKACMTGQRALKSLRQTVSCNNEAVDPVQMVLAIALHRFAESLKGSNTNNYVPHIQAISRIIKQTSMESHQTEIVTSITVALYEDEVFEALLRGKDSSFDKFASPTVSASKTNRVNDAILALKNLFVCIPRLARLVREALEHGDDHEIIAEASLLAQTIYSSLNNAFIEQTLAEEATPHPTAFVLMPPIDGLQSFQFPSLAAYVLATKYYTYRVLLCGLIKTLRTADLASGMFDEGEIQRNDISAATSIAMCVEHALGPAKPHPIVAMRLFLPMQLAFGTWHRLQQAESSKKLFAGTAYTHAVAMKHWCFGIARRIDHLWGGFPTDYHAMEKTVEMFAGGPLVSTISS